MNRIVFLLLFVFSFPLYSIDISELNNSDMWHFSQNGDVGVYTVKDKGKIPVLCFHMLNSEYWYGITPERFEDFLIYLKKNNFFPISDKNFIDRDFSSVPTGYTPIVLGADDASEGNFLYKTTGSLEDSPIDISKGAPQLVEKSMVYLLEKHLPRINGKINFTFYVSFNGVPFRQTGGDPGTGEYYRGIPIIGNKFNYILDNFYLGIHTVTHPVTKETPVEKFKWELDEFYSILSSYVGDRINMINTLAYPYGCGDLNPKLRDMISNYDYHGVHISGAFDFDGYFSKSPFWGIDNYEISRLGVDNRNIDKVYGFLKNVKLFKSKRVFVIQKNKNLDDFNLNENDVVIIE